MLFLSANKTNDFEATAYGATLIALYPYESSTIIKFEILPRSFANSKLKPSYTYSSAE